MRRTKVEHEQRALAIGKVVVYSILRDWLKGQLAAVACGILPFETVFLAGLALPTGATVLEYIEQEKLLAIAPPPH
jgi:hypothetical protein